MQCADRPVAGLDVLSSSSSAIGGADHKPPSTSAASVVGVTRLDWIALAVVALAGFVGLRKGLVASLLAITGIVAGAVIGARLAPVVLPRRGALALRAARRASAARSSARPCSRRSARWRARSSGRRCASRRCARSTARAGSCSAPPPGSRSSGSFGAAALLLPGQRSLRQERPALRGAAPPERDRPAGPAAERARPRRPVPVDRRPADPDEPPTAAIVRRPGRPRGVAERRPRARHRLRARDLRAAAGSPRPAWSSPPRTSSPASGARTSSQSGSEVRLPARPIGFDPKNDVAVLRVQGLAAAPLAIADPEPGASVAIVGYPLNGPLDVRGRADRPDREGAHRRRLRPRPGVADDHEPRAA